MNKVATFMRESSTARFFIPVGIMLIIFGIVFFSVNNKNKNYIKTTATVSNVEVLEEEYIDDNGETVEATYKVDLTYIVSDKEYSATLENVSKYKVGEKITIYYNPKDPSQITQTISMVLPIVIIALGVVSLIAGIISGVNTFKKYKKMKEQERNW